MTLAVAGWFKDEVRLAIDNNGLSLQGTRYEAHLLPNRYGGTPQIARWRTAGISVDVIAEKLHRHRSTIFRELRSNTFDDKDRRVTHAAITENKRLGDVLAYIKERQEQLPAPKVRTNSEKNGYTLQGRKPGRKTDFMNDPAVIARRRQALSDLNAAE
ncbi:hypothetical protein ABID08_006686 [Rhizobium binae]|uniref:Transposase IS30-like HTH domain-containing protein n=1 Tax=Rhizobium binae TaxID=1138190 RepID=A0ABV2MS58_9HYPH